MSVFFTSLHASYSFDLRYNLRFACLAEAQVVLSNCGDKNAIIWVRFVAVTSVSGTSQL